MPTSHAVNPATTLLHGRLLISRRGPTKRPILLIRFWCPAEHFYRESELPDHFMPDGVVEVEIPRGDDPTSSLAAAIAVDPDCHRQARDTLRHFAGRLRAWRSEPSAAGRFVPPTFASTRAARSPAD